MKKYLRDYSYLFILAGIIVGLDQWTKSLIRMNLEMGSVWSPWEWLSPYARIVHWYNTGVAFGLFQGQGMFFAFLALLVVGTIIYYFPKVDVLDWPLRLAMVLQLGGAVGNLVDRLMIGHVTDFISVGNFPVFNIADASISIGVGVLVLGIWFQEVRDRKNKTLLATQNPIIENKLSNKGCECE